MKEVIRTVVIVLLIVAAFYYAFIVDKVNNRMDFLNTQDSIHVEINDKLNRNLHDLELKFIGRGKHIHQFRRDLKQLDYKLDETSAIFQSKLDSLALIFSEFRMNTETALDILKTEHEDVSARLSKFQRQTNRSITDLQTYLSRLNRELGDLETKVKEIESPKKTKR